MITNRDYIKTMRDISAHGLGDAISKRDDLILHNGTTEQINNMELLIGCWQVKLAEFTVLLARSVSC